MLPQVPIMTMALLQLQPTTTVATAATRPAAMATAIQLAAATLHMAAAIT